MSKPKLRRVFHPYTDWEDANAGMWRNVSGEARVELLHRVTAFMTNTTEFYRFMLRVVAEWPIACAVNLSTRSINRQAWIGHAACAMATKSPEDVTRQGWHLLSRPLQDAANNAADDAIAVWERSQVTGGGSRAEELY